MSAAYGHILVVPVLFVPCFRISVFNADSSVFSKVRYASMALSIAGLPSCIRLSRVYRVSILAIINDWMTPISSIIDSSVSLTGHFTCWELKFSSPGGVCQHF